jgi:hypothetical protein
VEVWSEWQPLGDYLRDGVEYFVIDTRLFSPQHRGTRSVRGKNAKVRIYEELQASPEVRRVSQLRGRSLQGGERTLEIYRALPSGDDAGASAAEAPPSHSTGAPPTGPSS